MHYLNMEGQQYQYNTNKIAMKMFEPNVLTYAISDILKSVEMQGWINTWYPLVDHKNKFLISKNL